MAIETNDYDPDRLQRMVPAQACIEQESVAELLGRSSGLARRRPDAGLYMPNCCGVMTRIPTRDGLLKTPERMEKAMQDLTLWLQAGSEARFCRVRSFDVDYDEMVIVKDIEMYSLCEHHMLPFFGKVHIAYIPKGKVVGLSKIPRLVDVFARRLQVQERMTREIAEAIGDAIQAAGSGRSD